MVCSAALKRPKRKRRMASSETSIELLDAPTIRLRPRLRPPSRSGFCLQTLLDACLQFLPDAQRAQSQGVETNTKLFRDALAQINLRSLVRGVILLNDLPRMRRQLVETLVEAEMSRLLLVNIITDFHQSWHNGPLQ